ncbi:phage tail length tape measure family protein [Pulveribacter sp.]|uniref:phage tail length tape measure family protein n=1 Tax=Pulveribacter sp. TaxID=2678893 RepID=UPI0028B2161A|nr:phage tail length tape measure family protein [Pulveribacter sp.]
MASDLSIQGEVVVSAEKAEAAFARVGNKAEAMAGKVAGSADKAGKAVDGIGAGAEKGAEKFTRAEARIQAALVKATRDLENFGKTASQKFELTIDTKGLDRTKFEPALQNLRDMEQAVERAKRATSGLGETMQMLGRTLGTMAGGAAAYFSLRTFISETITAEQEQAQLTAVLKSTGEAAGWTRERLNAMASDLARNSTMSAGAINTAQTRLLSYTGIVGEQFPRAMQAVVDMSARMGMDVAQSAETIGRALDIPSQGLTALTRQGFRFTEAQKALVEQLEATGRTAEAQGIILAALESSYGGAAKAARDTLGGAIANVGKVANDLMAEFGNATGASSGLTSAINSVADAMGAMGKVFAENKPIITTTMGALAGGAALTSLAAIPRAIAAIGGAVTALGAVLAANPVVLTLLGIGAVVGGGVAAVNAYKQTADGIRSTIDVLEKENARAQKALDWSAGMGGAYQKGDDRTRELIRKRSEEVSRLREELIKLESGGETKGAGGGRGSINPPTVAEMNAQQAQKDEVLTDARRKLLGVNKEYLADLQKLNALYTSGQMSLEEYREHVTKLAGDTYKASEAGKSAAKAAKDYGTASESEVAGIQAKIAELRRYRAALEANGAAAEKMTDGERKVLQLREELQGKLAGAVRAEKERALAAAQVQVAEEKLTQAVQDRVKAEAAAEAEYRKGLAAMADKTDSIDKQARELEAANDTFGKSKIAVEEYIVAQREEQLAKLQGLRLTGEYTQELGREIEARKRLVAAMREAEFKAAGAKYDEALIQAREHNDLIREEISLIGLTEVERKKIIAAREVEIELAKELREIDKLGLDDAQKEELRIKARAKARTKAETAQAKATLDEWQKTADDINRALTDSLFRAFESGKDFGEALADTLKATFNTLVLRPIISAIVQPVSLVINGMVQGVLGGVGLGGGGGGVLGLVSNASTLNTGYQTLMGNSWINSAYNTTMGWLGIGGTQLGSGLTVGSSGLGMTAGGGGLGMKAPASFGSIGQGGGAALGAGAWMAAGAAAIIGLVANAMGMFGSDRRVGGGLTGEFGKGNIRRYELWRESGTLFGGPEYTISRPGDDLSSRVRRDISPEEEARYRQMLEDEARQGKALDDAFIALRTNTLKMADALGLSTDHLREWTTSVGTDLIHPDTGGLGIDFEGLDQEGIAKKIQEALETANNQLAEQLIGSWVTTTEVVRRTVETLSPSFGDDGAPGQWDEVEETITRTNYVQSEYAREGERAIDTLTRLATSLQATNAMFDMLGMSMFNASLAGGDLASQLIDAFGGLENMGQAAGAYFQNFYSADEQREYARRMIATQLEALELAMPDINAIDARDQFRALAEAQDLNTEAGRKAYATLLQLSGAFAQVTTSAEQAADAAKRQAEEARQNAIRSAYDLFRRAVARDRDALQDQASLIGDAISDISSSVDMLKSNARDLYGTVDSTAQMLAAQGMVYIEQALGGVRAGGSLVDYDRLDEAIGAARGGISNGAYASQFERDRDTLVLAGQLSELGELGDLQLSIEERQLKAINEQLEYLDRISKQAEEAVNGTAALDDTVEGYLAKLLALLTPKTPEAGKPTTGGSGGGFVSGPPSTGGDNTGATKDETIRHWVGGALLEGEASGKGHADPEVLRAVKDSIAFTGYTQADIARAYGVPVEDINRLFDGAGIPRFDVGTNYIQRTGLAVVHEGEAIVPKPFNPWAGGQGMGGNAELVAEVRALRQEVAELRSAAAATASNTAGLPTLVDQFDNVTEGGNAMRTEAMT